MSVHPRKTERTKSCGIPPRPLVLLGLAGLCVVVCVVMLATSYVPLSGNHAPGDHLERFALAFGLGTGYLVGAVSHIGVDE